METYPNVAQIKYQDSNSFYVVTVPQYWLKGRA